MISLEGKPEQLQFDYFCECIAFAGMTQLFVLTIVKGVRAIMEKSREALLELSEKIDINGLWGYIGDESGEYVVRSLENLTKTDAEKILFYKKQFKDVDHLLDMDIYVKKHIRFEQCQFENIRGLSGSHIVLDGCSFRHSEAEGKCFLSLQDARIIDTVFEDCHGINAGGLILLEDTTMSQTRFIDCSFSYKTDRHSLCIGKNTEIKYCEFMRCRVKGEAGNFNATLNKVSFDSIITIYGGKIQDTLFENCGFESIYGGIRYNDYMVLTDNEGGVSDNRFTNCQVYQHHCSCGFNTNTYNNIGYL
jgi:uncharacterized protein YjbI with pentapeptide repeats